MWASEYVQWIPIFLQLAFGYVARKAWLILFWLQEAYMGVYRYDFWVPLPINELYSKMICPFLKIYLQSVGQNV